MNTRRGAEPAAAIAEDVQLSKTDEQPAVSTGEQGFPPSLPSQTGALTQAPKRVSAGRRPLFRR